MNRKSKSPSVRKAYPNFQQTRADDSRERAHTTEAQKESGTVKIVLRGNRRPHTLQSETGGRHGIGGG